MRGSEAASGRLVPLKDVTGLAGKKNGGGGKGESTSQSVEEGRLKRAIYWTGEVSRRRKMHG